MDLGLGRGSSKRPQDATSPVSDRRMMRQISPKRVNRHGSSPEKYSDRYIPCRGSPSSSSLLQHGVDMSSTSSASSDVRDDAGKLTYNLLLKNELLGAGVDDMKYGDEKYRTGGNQEVSPNKSILKYKTSATGHSSSPSEPQSPFSLSSVGADSQRLLQSPRKTPRKISKVPFKVLDAPDLQDDFYLNLVDWSSQNVLCVGLGSCVYLWSACTSQVTKLCDLRADGGDVVTSVKWMQRGSHLAVGTNRGEVQIWDAVKCAVVKTMEGHTSRVGALAWNSNTLSSGSRDRKILQRDYRAPEPYYQELVAHKQEVCGLEWSPDDQHLASGGNDNKLFIWNAGYTTPRHRFTEHIAAVKAIAWSPHQHGLLASGGGTADQCIRFWNTLTSQPLQCIETKSQVCNLAWSKNANELVSTHGYSQNQIMLWKYPSMTQIATLTGHTYRVLYLAMSPDGQTIVTGAGDETLRFWNVFSKTRSPKQNKSVLNLFTHIR
eukprot:m.126247 g.126247  ORF g.126247 m.126247 type:complete len:490 (+) comp29192_c0_seq1:441-1910(+)